MVVFQLNPGDSGKLKRIDTNFLTKLGPFIEDSEQMALKYWHSMITKGVTSANPV